MLLGIAPIIRLRLLVVAAAVLLAMEVVARVEAVEQPMLSRSMSHLQVVGQCSASLV